MENLKLNPEIKYWLHLLGDVNLDNLSISLCPGILVSKIKTDMISITSNKTEETKPTIRNNNPREALSFFSLHVDYCCAESLGHRTQEGSVPVLAGWEVMFERSHCTALGMGGAPGACRPPGSISSPTRSCGASFHLPSCFSSFSSSSLRASRQSKCKLTRISSLRVGTWPFSSEIKSVRYMTATEQGAAVKKESWYYVIICCLWI